ncbi:uncharacterized protein LOC126678872 [Mercurialis annua]|uniref:uncharacterized protein LOC126678872 n=1 Tax=Mercurialis annua TaxID=3986 RepID=UPI0021606F6C|nr:uncharacterized protein LOC126678872 [Mercurialis annua]
MEEKSGSTNLKQKALYYYSDSDDNGSDNNGSDAENTDNEEEDLILKNLLHKMNLGPKKKLLVLSPGVLCQKIRTFDKNKPRNCTADARFGTILVFKRPYCDEFVKFCFERFEVGIWSSAIEKNLNNVLGCLLGELRSKVLFAWDQEECTDSGLKSLENNEKPLFFKELRKLWESKSPSLGQFSSSNTLMIDDKPYKCLLNPPNTGIFIDEYKAGLGNDDVLGENGELRVFLDGVAEADDVASYVEENPFGQPAITSDHPDWGFYAKIVRRFGRK